MGIYERMIYFLAHIKENFRENVLYFLPVGIGIVLGIALFSLPVEYLLEHYKIIVLWGFAGAIIGTIPSLLNESVRESDRDRTDVIWFVATFFISGVCLYFLNSLVGTLPANFLTFILAGALIALGILVPGLSPSNLLLILVPNHGNSESIHYANTSIITFVTAAFFFGLGTWLGAWMNQLEEKYK